MNRNIVIPIEQYKCLRGHLDAIEKILGGQGEKVGSKASERLASKPAPKESKSDKINKYSKIIGSGQRVKKPNHLRQ